MIFKNISLMYLSPMRRFVTPEPSIRLQYFLCQTKVAYKKFAIKHHILSVSPDPYFETEQNFLYMLIWGMPSFYLYRTFTSEAKQMWHMYTYVLKHPIRHIYDIFHVKQTYRNVVFRDYILTSALYTYCTHASLNAGGIKFIKLIIFKNILNLFSLSLSIEYLNNSMSRVVSM